MSIQALREQKLALSKEANNVLTNKGDQVWTKEDQAKFDEVSDKLELVNTQIDAHQKMLDDAAENSFDDVDEFRIKGKKGEKPTEAKFALNAFLRKTDRQMSDEESNAIRNTMSTTTGSEGGFTQAPQVASDLIDLMKAFGFMRKVAEQITTSTGVDLSYPTSDGTSEIGEWVAQNTLGTDLDPTFGTRPVNAFKAGSKVVTVPIELLQDSQIDVQALIFKRLATRIGRISNQGYSVGSGTGQPFGISTAAGIGKTGTTGQTTTLIYDDLVDLVDSLDAAYLDVPGIGFMMSQTLRRVIRKIKDTTGRPIWTPGYEAGMTAATPDILLGYNVFLNNDLAAPAANAKSLAFGDFSKYQIRDAMDVTLFKFDDSAYVKKGCYGFMAWARTGGNLLDLNAVKFYQHSAT